MILICRGIKNPNIHTLSCILLRLVNRIKHRSSKYQEIYLDKNNELLIRIAKLKHCLFIVYGKLKYMILKYSLTFDTRLCYVS